MTWIGSSMMLDACSWQILAVLVLILAVGGCGDSDSSSPDGANSGESLSAVTDTTSLLTVLKTDDRFTTFVTALDSAGLSSELAQGGPYTVFAPTNAAFEALPPGTLSDLLAPERQARLRVILEHHLIPQRLSTRDLVRASPVQTRAEASLSIQEVGGDVQVDSVSVRVSNVETANGVIHVLDAVLRPPG